METEAEEDMELEGYDHHVEASTPEEYDEEEDEEEEDPIYEFDAPRYYDFTRPETHLQALEAERWFDSATGFPPSPFLAKLNPVKNSSGEENVSPRRKNCSSMDTDSGIESSGKNIVKIPSPASSNSVVIRASTLMKPTVSTLAKHRHPYEIKRLLRTRMLRMHCRTATAQYDNNPATKRQKLENGYLKKDAQLKHQAVLPHKLCKTATDNNINQLNCSRPPPKVTIPKEPQLETARRAQRRRSKTSVESSVTTKSNLLSPPPKARTPFTRKTVKSIDSQDDAAENKKQVAAEVSNNSKYESPYRFKARKLEKVPKLPKEKHEMPIRLFEKMTLEPKAQNKSNKRL